MSNRENEVSTNPTSRKKEARRTTRRDANQSAEHALNAPATQADIVGVCLVVAQLIQQQQQTRAASQPVPSLELYYERFRKLNPPLFEGGPDLMAAKIWIREMEKMFDALQYPENVKVRIGRMVRDYPIKKKDSSKTSKLVDQKQQENARVFALTQQDASASNQIVADNSTQTTMNDLENNLLLSEEYNNRLCELMLEEENDKLDKVEGMKDDGTANENSNETEDNEGFRNFRKGDEERQRIQADSRTGCQALIAIKKTKDGKWVALQVVETHNHPLTTPSKTRNHRSHGHISNGEAEMIKNMHSVGIRTNLIMSVMAVEVGGSQNVSFREKDIRNFCQKEWQKGDAAAMLEYLERQQVDNPSFFYSIQADSEGHMTNFFWADARSRIDYHYFGDVVCFDPTYLTNRYGMPFVPIIGIDHHYQTIIFGGALLFDEREESFAWVFSTWMKAMEGKRPKVILTDQESAIGGAISLVLPESRHRFCIWHIMRNGLKNIPHVFNKYKGFENDFTDCLYGGETVEEFEVNWGSLLDKYN
uniref:Protein FAR1-RELATED SEQUENCE 5-like n=1 Tax=Elaeis guineensis var. tenera TaxID=51953 RepID=A0A6I9SLJ7_ELAGV|nr:protein FAR1-RELATED SEQUENCE 5-like [Elaeis guineensis]